MGQDERHYDPNKLNKIFAIAAIILLSAVVFLFAKDYLRKWKDYQGNFRALEKEKAHIKYDAVAKKLENDPQYKTILEDYNKAKTEYEASCNNFAEVESELAKLAAKDDVVQQKNRFKKAELSAARYRFEAARSHGEGHSVEIADLEKEYIALSKEVKDLDIAVQESGTLIQSKRSVIDQCGEKLQTLEREKNKLSKQKDILEKKLSKVDPAHMSFPNQIANMVRDLPVIDLANPNNKIEQIVLRDITDDVNFLHVPKVERCTTCHLGITDPSYAKEPQPFKTHPNLEQYIGKDSPHPLEEFGCTSCHGGRGRSTDFVGAVHSPSSEEQKKEWIKKHNWKPMDLWEEPMHPMPYVEAGCFKCHSQQQNLKGAPKLNLGLGIIEKAGCYNCHKIDRYEGWPKSGPDLTRVASKLTKDWAYKWIEDPKSFRHNTWMPAYFNQSNNSDLESVKRGEQEIHAIVQYLFMESKDYPLAKIPAAGDVKRGEELVKSVGCFACHQIKPEAGDEALTMDSLRKQHGPNLIGMASKTSKEWVYDWVKNPSKYHPDTRMPDLRLTDQEASDVAEFLSSGHNESFESKAVPAINEEVINNIVLGLKSKESTFAQASKEVKAMTLDDKLYFAGKKLVGQYGCYACHNISGFESAKPIGVELTEEGSKSLHKFDFGFIHLDHTKEAWLSQKLHSPRSFDQGKELKPDEKLIMPNFNLSEEEIQAAVTALLGFVKQTSVKNKVYPRTPENKSIEEGQKIVKQFNCQGCHMIEGEGRSVEKTVNEWLVQFEGNSQADADKYTDSYSPPSLFGVGSRVNTQWLFEFLHNPGKQNIRPWVKVRMPTYDFNSSHLNMLVKYFNTLDKEEYPFQLPENTKSSQEEFTAAEKLFSEEYFGCTKCHVVGDKNPTGTKDTWAPNLALAKTRLKPGWLLRWIKDPQDVVPGTKMPTFYDPASYSESGPVDILDGDEDRQIRALRNYLLNLSESKPVASTPKAVVAPAPVLTDNAASKPAVAK